VPYLAYRYAMWLGLSREEANAWVASWQ
jgi:hypothetical protein